MVTLKIDGRSICVPEGTTILDAALSAGIHIPHLCYLKGINEIGACRLCCVEVEGEEPAADPQPAQRHLRPLRAQRQL